MIKTLGKQFKLLELNLKRMFFLIKGLFYDITNSHLSALKNFCLKTYFLKSRIRTIADVLFTSQWVHPSIQSHLLFVICLSFEAFKYVTLCYSK